MINPVYRQQAQGNALFAKKKHKGMLKLTANLIVFRILKHRVIGSVSKTALDGSYI
jgi:hypothetical protein